MKVIQVHIQPFEMSQQVYILDNENKTFERNDILTKNLDNYLIKTCYQEKINNVVLTGSKMYNTGIKHRIVSKEIDKYNKNNIKITLK